MESVQNNPQDHRPNGAAFGCYRRRRGPGIAFGISVVLLGTLLLLQNLGVLATDSIGRLWPVLLIGAGLSRLFSTTHPGIRLWGAALTAAGSVLLLTNFHYLNPHIWRYIGPSAMILWGIALLALGPRFRHIGSRLTANQG